MKMLTALLFAFAFMPATAQTTTKNFLGMDFHKPLLDGEECPKHLAPRTTIYVSTPDDVNSFCWERTTTVSAPPNSVQLHHIPNLSNNEGSDMYMVFATIIDGNVEYIKMYFPASDAKPVLNGLRVKFGRPGTSSIVPLTTLLGVKYSRTNSTWNEGSFRIDYQSLGSNIETGSVEAYTDLYASQIHMKAADHRKKVEKAF